MENQRYSAPRAGCYAMSQAAVYSTLFRQSQWAKNCNELQAFRVEKLTHLQQQLKMIEKIACVIKYWNLIKLFDLLDPRLVSLEKGLFVLKVYQDLNRARACTVYILSRAS